MKHEANTFSQDRGSGQKPDKGQDVPKPGWNKRVHRPSPSKGNGGRLLTAIALSFLLTQGEAETVKKASHIVRGVNR